MDRTKNRPVPSGRMSVNVAVGVAILLTIIGLTFVYDQSKDSNVWCDFNIFIHECLYTFKTVTSLSVLLVLSRKNFMLGWVAATGNFGMKLDFINSVLFGTRIFGQLMVLYEEEEKAGFFSVTGKSKR
jgi:protoheme IX farnesyltransferase